VHEARFPQFIEYVAQDTRAYSPDLFVSAVKHIQSQGFTIKPAILAAFKSVAEKANACFEQQQSEEV
jgi:hypothetical protein